MRRVGRWYALLLVLSGGCAGTGPSAPGVSPGVPFPGDLLPDRHVSGEPLTLPACVTFALVHGRLDGESVEVLRRDAMLKQPNDGPAEPNKPALIGVVGKVFSRRGPNFIPGCVNSLRPQKEFERTLHDLVFAVEETYAKLHAARALLDARRRVLGDAKRERDDAAKLLDAGRLTRQDLSRIDEQVALAEADALSAAADAHEAAMLFRQVVGFSPGPASEIVLGPPQAIEPPDPDVGPALRTAWEHRPEPTLAHLEVSDTMNAMVPSAKRKPSALLEHERARFRLAETRERIEVEVRQAHLRLVEGFGKLRLLDARRSAVESRLRALLEKNREKPFADLAELLAARKDLAEAERDEIKARAAAAILRADFDRKQGVLYHRYSTIPPARLLYREGHSPCSPPG